MINSNEMKTGRSSIYLFIFLVAGFITSCTKDLDQYPHEQLTSPSVYTSVENYKSVLAKLYASLAVAGIEKGDANADMAAAAASYGYMRAYFNLQEIPTDEVIYTWAGGDNLTDVQYIKWGASDTWVSAMYYRIYYTIALCNELLRNATDDKISGFSSGDQQQIREFRADARFLRALAYSHAMDLFGNVPFVTENDKVGTGTPARIVRKDLFNYIESELKAISPALPAPLQNEYGRASRAAAWSLLAKNYLNAEVYTGAGRYADCITYCDSVIAGGYSLEASYAKLFNASNNLRAQNEIIFPVEADVQHTTTWGSTTYLVCGPIVGSMDPAASGVNNAWNSIRTLREFVSYFPDVTGQTDKRGRFWTDGQTLDVSSPSTSSQGYSILKFTNLKDDGTYTTDDGLVSTDFPMIRLADVYLMYAEAYVRGGGGTLTKALSYVNLIRERAYGNTSGDINAGSLTLDFLLAERARELFWECTRRTDLIRFNKFTGSSHLWQWKGGTENGISVDSKYNLYPIPATDLSANPNLVQNTGY